MSRAYLFFLGGTEWYDLDNPIFKRMKDLFREDGNIVILPTATSYPKSTGESYSQFFRRNFSSNVNVVPLLERRDSSREGYIQSVEKADLVFFTGGDQYRIINALRDTPVNDVLINKLDEEVLIGGTSAGAMVLGDIAILNTECTGLNENDVEWDYGLDLIRRVTVDTHFVMRKRLWRFLCLLSKFPENIGIGIAEDTGVIYDMYRREFEVLGDDYVLLIEPPYQRSPKNGKTERYGYRVNVLTDGATFSVTRGARVLFK